jgi:uncharacterized membrane protein YedE/YeeE
MPSKKSGSWFKSAFTFGLGAGLGAGISTMLFIVLGLLFFIPGVLLLAKERKKPKDKQQQSMFILAYVLLVLGAIFGLGMGANFIFSNLMEDI